jgi:hypothetical protein
MVLSVGCAMISSAMGEVTGTTGKKREEARIAEVQVEVMRYADDYATTVVQAAGRIELPTDEKRLAVVSWQLEESTAAYDVATGPNPLLNVVDMVVLVALSRWAVEKYWVPEVFGESGRPLLAACVEAESKAWAAILPLLKPAPEKELRERIERWEAANPKVYDVSSIRFDDVERAAKGHGNEVLGTPTALLAPFGLDPFATFEPAVQQVERTRVLAERAMYFAKRWPFLLNLQAEKLALELALQPQSQRVFGDADRLSRSAEAFGKVAEDIPALVDREREAAIRQFLDAAKAHEDRAQALFAELTRTLNAGNAAATSANGAIRSLESFVAMVSPPSPAGTPPGKAFDVNDYTRGFVEFSRAMDDARGLVDSLDKDAPRLEEMVQKATKGVSEDGRRLVDYAFRRGMALIAALVGGLFGAALLYRFLAVRIDARAASRKEG